MNPLYILTIAGVLLIALFYYKSRYFKKEREKIEYLKQHGWLVREVETCHSGFGTPDVDYEFKAPGGIEWLPLEKAYEICKSREFE